MIFTATRRHRLKYREAYGIQLRHLQKLGGNLSAYLQTKLKEAQYNQARDLCWSLHSGRFCYGLGVAGYL